jgi:hypothetical protein
MALLCAGGHESLRHMHLFIEMQVWCGFEQRELVALGHNLARTSSWSTLSPTLQRRE